VSPETATPLLRPDVPGGRQGTVARRLVAPLLRDHPVTRPVVVDRVPEVFAASLAGLGLRLAAADR
jgi:hypothetical protein